MYIFDIIANSTKYFQWAVTFPAAHAFRQVKKEPLVQKSCTYSSPVRCNTGEHTERKGEPFDALE
jgi:hypothetical protein